MANSTVSLVHICAQSQCSRFENKLYSLFCLVLLLQFATLVVAVARAAFGKILQNYPYKINLFRLKLSPVMNYFSPDIQVWTCLHLYQGL